MPYPKLVYVNHLGQTYDFEKDRIWPLSEELFDFSIDYEVSNNHVASRSFPTVEIPLTINMEPDDAAMEMNLLYRTLMPDVLANVPGRLYDGSWYVECLLKQSEKRYWYRDGQFRSYTQSLFVPYPVWTRDVEYTFDISVDNSAISLKYPHGYPHGYGGSTPIESIFLDAISDCDLKISMFGPVVNPVLSIGSNTYQINSQVPEGAVLTIDTRLGKAQITTADKTVVDVFSASPDEPPGSGFYIFERLSPGYHTVSWDGSFMVSIVLYLEQVGERQW